MVIPIFSSGRLGPTRIPLARGVGGISHDSVLFCEELATVDAYFIREGPLGRPVPGALLQQVVVAVRRAIGDTLL